MAFPLAILEAGGAGAASAIADADQGRKSALAGRWHEAFANKFTLTL